MKIYNVEIESKSGKILSKKIAKNLWEITENVTIVVTTDQGCFRYIIKAGMITDYRSGPKIANFILPKKGRGGLYDAAIICHDCNYFLSGKGLEFVASNKLFYTMLLFAGVSKWRAKLGFKSVSSFFGKNAFDDECWCDKINNERSCIGFTWCDR